MIPPQVGMSLRLHKKIKDDKEAQIKKEAKEAQTKNEKRKKWEKREKGQCYYPFSTLVFKSSTMIFTIESLLCCHFHILVGILHYRTWLIFQWWASSNCLFGTVHCPFSPWELVQTSPVHPNPVTWYALSSSHKVFNHAQPRWQAKQLFQTFDFLKLFQSSRNIWAWAMDIALWWNRMVVVEKTKKEKIVSHQLGVSMGYGNAH